MGCERGRATTGVAHPTPSKYDADAIEATLVTIAPGENVDPAAFRQALAADGA